MKNKLTNKKRLQKLLVIVLLLLVTSMGGYQIYEYLEQKEEADDVVYTAAIFNAPMAQSIEVLLISETDEKESIIDNNSNKIQYSDIKNYVEENLDRYVSYHKLHPELLDAEVIWRVNTKLDYDFYRNYALIEDPLSLTVVVNKYNILDSGFEPDDLVLIEGTDMYLRLEAYDAYLKMKEAMNKVDLNIEITSAYRSFNTQKELYNSYVDEHGVEEADTFSARPGHSGHQLGLVIDVHNGKVPYTSFGKTEEYAWIKDNAHRYGYIIRYKANPELTGYQVEEWHLRYVGEEVAVDMYESNIHILEEYLDKRGL